MNQKMELQAQNSKSESRLNFKGSLSSEKIKKYHRIQKLNNLKAYTCSHCLHLYNDEKSFMAHLLIHSRQNYQKNFLIAYSSKKIKKSIIMLKKRIQKYKCMKCNQSFYMKTTLKKHLMSISHVEFKCDQCQATFQNEYSLVLHKDFHLRQSEFSFPLKMNKTNKKKEILIPKIEFSSMPKVNKISITKSYIDTPKVNLGIMGQLKCKDCGKVIKFIRFF